MPITKDRSTRLAPPPTGEWASGGGLPRGCPMGRSELRCPSQYDGEEVWTWSEGGWICTSEERLICIPEAERGQTERLIRTQVLRIRGARVLVPCAGAARNRWAEHSVLPFSISAQPLHLDLWNCRFDHCLDDEFEDCLSIVN